jgi:hypothetical protein
VDYSDLVDTAAELIAEYGQPATLRRVVNLAADAAMTIAVDATGKTFTRNPGSWVTDGFKVGDSITFANFANAGNNAAFVVSTVSALVLTCSTATGLVDESDVYDVTGTANQDAQGHALEQDVNSVSLFAASLVEGSLVSESTRFFMLAEVTPQVNDRLVIGSMTYTIEGKRALSPGATAIYHVVRVKA